MIKDVFAQIGLPPDQPGFWLALVLLTVTMFLAVQLRNAHKKEQTQRGALENVRLDLAGVRARADEAEVLKTSLEAERVARGAIEATQAATMATLAERERAIKDMQTRLDAEFKATTAEMLDGAHKAFLERAKQTFDHYSKNANAEGENRRKALDEMLRPVSETLVRYEQGLSDLRKEQQESRGKLAGQIGALAQSTQDVRMEAQKLSTALRAGPKTRGRWGEEQLRNVVEIAGMTAYVDFVEQATHDDDGKRKQPDMVVRMPGARVIAVDSKVSLGAYLDAVEAETDEERTASMLRHGDDLWAHVKALSAKDYAASLRDALDYVVMFVPGENYFSAALEARPALYQDAFDRKILIASPTILIALLKTAALNWRQEKMTENAQAVAAMAKDIYDSLRRMGENLSKLGASIETSVKRYNDVVANVEGRVMPRARKFAEFELPGTHDDIKEIQPLEGATRELRSGRDLFLADTSEEEPDAA